MTVETASTPEPPLRQRLRAAAVVLTWVAAVSGLTWAVIRLAGLERGPLVQLMAFTPYMVLWSLAAAGAALALKRWRAVGVALLASLMLAVVVTPRAFAADQPDASGPSLRVLTANLLAGAADLQVLALLVAQHRVDLLALQEFTPAAARELDRLGLTRLLPYRQVHPVVGTGGSALYSRYPLHDGGARRNEGGFWQAYAAVEVPGAAPLLAESVHVCAPYALSQEGCWRTDLTRQPTATPHGPVRVLLGDFNATLDHAPLRRLLDSGYVDAADAVGAGLAATWGPFDGDPIPPVTIDHVLVDQRVEVRLVRVLRLPGTDHRPVLAKLVLPAA